MGIKNALFHDEWHIAIREATATPIFSKQWASKPFYLLQNSPRFWYADPFLFEYNHSIYLFAERKDKLKGYADIVWSKIEEGKIGRFRTAFSSGKHLSFPFLFSSNNQIYMIPESFSENQLYLLCAKHFPDQWEKKCVLANGEFNDTVLYRDGNLQLLITSKYNATGGSDNLWILQLNNSDEVISYSEVYSGKLSGARNGGCVFHNKNITVRPSQDCADRYGGSIVFQSIDSIDGEHLEEHELYRLTPDKIHTLQKIPCAGVHTYNACDRYEAIDVLVHKAFDFPTLFFRVFSKIRALIKRK